MMKNVVVQRESFVAIPHEMFKTLSHEAIYVYGYLKHFHPNYRIRKNTVWKGSALARTPFYRGWDELRANGWILKEKVYCNETSRPDTVWIVLNTPKTIEKAEDSETSENRSFRETSENRMPENRTPNIESNTLSTPLPPPEGENEPPLLRVTPARDNSAKNAEIRRVTKKVRELVQKGVEIDDMAYDAMKWLQKAEISVKHQRKVYHYWKKSALEWSNGR